MAYGTRVIFEAVRELAASALSGSYVALGVPTTGHVRLLSINNSAAEEIYVSFDGTTDHLRLSGNSFKLLDLSANKVRDDGLFIPIGTQISIRFVSTTTVTGAVWAEIMDAEGGK